MITCQQNLNHRKTLSDTQRRILMYDCSLKQICNNVFRVKDFPTCMTGHWLFISNKTFRIFTAVQLRVPIRQKGQYIPSLVFYTEKFWCILNKHSATNSTSALFVLINNNNNTNNNLAIKELRRLLAGCGLIRSCLFKDLPQLSMSRDL
jgi:hypothetical protein